MCVNAPVPDDVADGPQPVAGAHPLVDLDRAGGRVEADRLEPEVVEVGVRPAATSSFSKRRAPGRPTATRELAVVVRHLRDGDAGQHLDALAREHVGDQRLRPRARPGRGCGRPTSSTVTRTPNRASAWASSAPIGPPPMTTSEPGSGVDPQHVAVGPERRVRQPVDRRRRRARCPGLSTTPRDASNVSPSTSTVRGPVSRAVAAHEADAGVLEPLHRDRVVPVVGGLVADPVRAPAPSRGGRRPSPASPSIRRPSASTSAARMIILLGMQP